MNTIKIQRSLAGFPVNGGELLALGTAERLAISLAVALAAPVAIMVFDADPKTYEFSPGAAFEWMTLGKT